MNYKIVFIALAIMLVCVIPASAVWSNDNWIDSEHSDQYFGTAKVVTDPATGVTSKYNPVINTDPDSAIWGYVEFMMRAGGADASLDHIVWYRNIKNPNASTFNASYYPDGTDFPGINEGWERTEILADGLSKWIPLGHGTYEACIANGNGGQPECYQFDIGNAEVKRVAFLGHAVSKSYNVCQPSITIKSVSYCGETESHVVHHAAIPAVPAYYTVAPASFHQECSGWGWNYHCHTVYDGDCEKVSGPWYDFKVGNQKYRFVSHGDYQSTYHAYVPEVPAWDETVIDHQGGCAYPKEELQSVVDRGITSFLFDNRPADGGIFSADGSELLSPITDPASGIQKHVSITYNAGCGTGDKTIEAMEYEVINL